MLLASLGSGGLNVNAPISDGSAHGDWQWPRRTASLLGSLGAEITSATANVRAPKLFVSDILLNIFVGA